MGSVTFIAFLFRQRRKIAFYFVARGRFNVPHFDWKLAQNFDKKMKKEEIAASKGKNWKGSK